jgi:adenylate cyclase
MGAYRLPNLAFDKISGREFQPVSAGKIERRFAVVLCADVVGYSRLMGMDDEGTLAALNAALREVVDPKIIEYGGRTVRTMGDGLLVEFISVVDAVKCAIGIQSAMPERTRDVPPERQIQLRVGINIGDVLSDGEAIYGDGIAVASRLESLAQPGTINVSRAVRDQVRDQLPFSFIDLGEHEVVNIARPVRAFRIVLDREKPSTSSTARARSTVSAERPAVAVLPFRNLGGDAEAEFFLDSVAEDLITELSRARWFSVIARNTAFSYKGKGFDPKQIARELGARYFLEGTLRKAGDRVRISCQLVEATTGQHLWAERFDGTLEDSFDLQDRITESVIGAVGPVLRGAEIDRVGRKPAASQDAYDLTLRSMFPAFAETEEENQNALRLLNGAMEIYPGYPAANALAAWCHHQRHMMEWPSAREDDRQTAKLLARAAINGGTEVPLALALAGAVRASLSRDHDLALAAVDRAAMLCNNSALVLGFDALTRCICGDYDKAIAHAEKAIRLSPLEPFLYHAAFALALACLLAAQDEDAARHARKAIDGNPNCALAHCALSMAYARLGRVEEAEQTIRRLVAVAPRFRIGTLRRIRFADPGRLRPDLDLLRAAGLPD